MCVLLKIGNIIQLQNPTTDPGSEQYSTLGLPVLHLLLNKNLQIFRHSSQRFCQNHWFKKDF